MIIWFYLAISKALWLSRLLCCCCCFANCWINTELSRSAYRVTWPTMRLSSMGERAATLCLLFKLAHWAYGRQRIREEKGKHCGDKKNVRLLSFCQLLSSSVSPGTSERFGISESSLVFYSIMSSWAYSPVPGGKLCSDYNSCVRWDTAQDQKLLSEP